MSVQQQIEENGYKYFPIRYGPANANLFWVSVTESDGFVRGGLQLRGPRWLRTRWRNETLGTSQGFIRLPQGGLSCCSSRQDLEPFRLRTDVAAPDLGNLAPFLQRLALAPKL